MSREISIEREEEEKKGTKSKSKGNKMSREEIPLRKLSLALTVLQQLQLFSSIY